jgi:glutathione-regulated potassium-efflux system ancillary protein KefF
MILVVYAHPYPSRSRASAALLAGINDLPEVSVRSLYDLYPDFDIDVEAEQAALSAAQLVVWLHPIYWYSVPGLLKQWFDVVLTRGWAYGHANGKAGAALHGKDCLWVSTTGGTEQAYTTTGAHQRAFEDFLAPIEQTAKFCGMTWLPPITAHGAHVVSDDALREAGLSLRARLLAWRENKAMTPQLGASDAG